MLGWHVRPAPGYHAYPALFRFITAPKAVEQLVEAGCDFRPFLGYCVVAPVRCSSGKSSEGGTPDQDVLERFNLLMWAGRFGQSGAVKSLLQIGQLLLILPQPLNMDFPICWWRSWVNHLCAMVMLSSCFDRVHGVVALVGTTAKLVATVQGCSAPLDDLLCQFGQSVSSYNTWDVVGKWCVCRHGPKFSANT